MKQSLSLYFFILIMGGLLIISCGEDTIGTTDLSDSVPSLKTIRNCGLDEHMLQLLSDPDYAREREQRIARFEKYHSSAIEKAACTDPVIIPVAVHFQGIQSPNESCLVQLAQRQIDILNEDFSGLNPDISNWTGQASSYFPNVEYGEACIQFALANKNHPAGYSLSDGDAAVTINLTSGDQVNDWSGYLNIFVQTGTGVLGYAPLGGIGNGDGVVIDASAFGANINCGSVSPQSPFNLGRTTTHEIGHYLLLDHIWGSSCQIDDNVSDTPEQASEYYDCPVLGASSCGSADMHMNYMDYVNDACMYMYTTGQTQRMENYMFSNLGFLISNASNVIDGTEDQSGGGAGGSGDAGGTDNDPGEDPILQCQAPAQTTVDILSPTSVVIDWADIPDATRYRVLYREEGTSWIRRNVNQSEITINNLVPGRSYQYQIRTKCPDGWTPFGERESFITSSTGGESTSFTLVITLDDYGSETTWYIVDENYNDIYSGGPYNDFQAGRTIEESVDLSNGCYSLEIYDAWGDGMCCDYGEGSVELLDTGGRSIAYSDGFFGTYDIIEFCVTAGSARLKDQKKNAKVENRATKTKR